MTAGAIPLNEISLICGQRKALWSMRPCMHVSRRTLDWQLMQTAMQAGATVLMETQARIEAATVGASSITVQLKHRSAFGRDVRYQCSG